MLPVQDDAGFHEGGQYVHLTEVNPVPFDPAPLKRNQVPGGNCMGGCGTGSSG